MAWYDSFACNDSLLREGEIGGFIVASLKNLHISMYMRWRVLYAETSPSFDKFPRITMGDRPSNKKWLYRVITKALYESKYDYLI